MPASAHSSLSNIAAAKPRSETDPVQCTQEYHHLYPYCNTVAEEEPPSSSAVKNPFLPFQVSGSQCSVAATPVHAEIRERQPRAEASFSHSRTPSMLCRRWPPDSARSDTRMSTPVRAQRNSRPANTSELQEHFRRMNIGSTASSMASLATSSSDLEQWSGSTDEQEVFSFHPLHCKSVVFPVHFCITINNVFVLAAADFDTDYRKWQSKGKFLLDRKKMAKMIAVHKTCHYHQYGQDLTTIIPMSTQRRGIKLTFEVFPYGIDADIQSRHATVLVRVSQCRLSCQDIADNCICTVKVKVKFVNSLTLERLSSREEEAEISQSSCEACIQISQALLHSDILYSTANIQMLVEAEFHCQDKVVAAISDDQDCSDYVFLTITPNEQ